MENVKKTSNLIEKTELIFAFLIILLPLIISFIDIFAKIPAYFLLLIFYMVAYLIFFYIKIIKHKVNFKILYDSITKILVFVLLGWIIFTNIINNALNLDFIVHLSYFVILLNMLFVDKKYRKLLVQSSVFVITICAIMSIIDPNALFMPGFINPSYKFSAQFCNPNHFGYIIVIMTIISCGLFDSEKNIYLKYLNLLCFIIMSFYMFFNGAYGSLLSIIIGLIGYIIYLWIKNRKFPIVMFLLLIMFLNIGVVVEVTIPFCEYRTNEYGFYMESVAVFDNIFGTDFLSNFGIDEIIGADGWDREDLVLASLLNLKDNYLFGNGSGCAGTMGPHNEFLFLSLDHGYFAGFLYMFLILFVILKNILNYDSDKMTILLSFASLGYFISGSVGTLTSHSYYYFLVVIALSTKSDVKFLNNSNIYQTNSIFDNKQQRYQIYK